MDNLQLKVKSLLLTVGLVLTFFSGVRSQNSVSIGTEEINTNAVLQLVSPGNDQGLLLPQLHTSDRQGMTLSDDDNGLLVFDVDLGKFFYWHEGSWYEITNGTPAGIIAGEGISIEGSTISNTGDLDATNELQLLSISNDTIYLSNGGYVKLPSGGTVVSFNDLTNVPPNLDTDATDDFDGQYSSLTGAPTNVSAFTNDAGYITSLGSVDTSMTNEIQTISRDGLIVTLSNGGGSFTDSVNTYTAGTGIDITGNVISTDETPLAIGDSYQGGLIFWLDETGKHGLIVAPEDQDNGSLRQWALPGFFNVQTFAYRHGVGAGAYNTERIVAIIGQGNYAAWMCSYYQGGDYGDWYLPSREEMQLLMLSGVGDMAMDFAYWTSNETTTTDAYLSSGMSVSKTYTQHIRAIRRF